MKSLEMIEKRSYEFSQYKKTKEGYRLEMIKKISRYNKMKERYPDCLLLFRCGDFYECYEKDAVAASTVLGIPLLKHKENGKSASVATAGFPLHALDTYLPKLIRAGHRIVICDTLNEPETDVKEIITPSNM